LSFSLSLKLSPLIFAKGTQNGHYWTAAEGQRCGAQRKGHLADVRRVSTPN
jgi:hypothetical protein